MTVAFAEDAFAPEVGAGLESLAWQRQAVAGSLTGKGSPHGPVLCRLPQVQAQAHWGSGATT